MYACWHWAWKRTYHVFNNYIQGHHVLCLYLPFPWLSTCCTDSVACSRLGSLWLHFLQFSICALSPFGAVAGPLTKNPASLARTVSLAFSYNNTSVNSAILKLSYYCIVFGGLHIGEFGYKSSITKVYSSPIFV